MNDKGSQHENHTYRGSKFLKQESRSKERSSLRDAIDREDWDSIPQNKPIKTGNPRNWG